MTVLDLAYIGEPVLRERARPVTTDELASSEIQTLVDDLIATMRHHHGAGLAAPQVHVPLRIVAVEVEQNERYPYKPRIPLRVLVNPVVRPIGTEVFRSYEGCLSVPDLRGSLLRHAVVELDYLDRSGQRIVERVTGLSAGTFQHENDHLDGVLFLDRVDDPTSFTTWAGFRKYHEKPWLAGVRPVIVSASIDRLETP